MKHNNQLDLFQESLDKWKGRIDASKSRNADFNTLSGHNQDVCYFPEEPETQRLYIDKV